MYVPRCSWSYVHLGMLLLQGSHKVLHEDQVGVECARCGPSDDQVNALTEMVSNVQYVERVPKREPPELLSRVASIPADLGIAVPVLSELRVLPAELAEEGIGANREVEGGGSRHNRKQARQEAGAIRSKHGRGQAQQNGW
ncbi:hypothetical protein B296_00052920 [Ensete ventricosum]|uniref:Uncharacterized protein n=1 Tax=Ensete ventricosum TaxID=4639 RepID=A0A426X919_ENSVE|nr:hypothetical protein B296_00052920 [Ensete ventricosum]